MLTQDFGPIRLMLPSIDVAIDWRRSLLRFKEAADLSDPVEGHLARAAWAANAAGALSADTNAEDQAQTWGALARGKSPVELLKDGAPGAVAIVGLQGLGASYSDLVNLGDEILDWLTAQILAPVEAGEKTARFFARPKVA